MYAGKGRGKKEGATTESPVDGQDQPKIYTIRDHTLEVLMHPDVLELHAVKVVHTPHGDGAVALESACTVQTRGVGGGCLGGYGCPGEPGPEGVAQGGILAAQP